MRTGRQTARDLVEEAKKRIVLLLICVFGLSYLMSLTSSSVWINLPAAAMLIIFCRYMFLDLDIRKKSATGNKLPVINSSSKKRSIELYTFPLEKSNWRNKVNSLVVEEAIDHFTRHLISEWVTDLWYSRITPDRDGPEELVQAINDVFGEFSSRARDINLIDLLTRDIINLLCNHLELSRSSISKIGRQEFKKLPPEHKDFQLKQILAAGNKLHPALFSMEAEHKVLQHLVNGLMLVAFNPKDLQCSFFRYASRELLACAVFRPIINLANPRFLNEKIESLVISFTNKSEKEAQNLADHAITVQANVSTTAQIEQLSSLVDPSAVGVELMQFRHGLSNIPSNEQVAQKEGILNHRFSSSANFAGTGDTILMPNARTNGDQSLHSDSFPSDTRTTCANLTGTSFSKGEWGQILDIISQRKRQALEPEHLENVWTKGRNYRKKEGSKQSAKQNADVRSTCSSNTNKPLATSSNLKNNKMTGFDDSMKVSSSFHEGAYLAENVNFHVDCNGSAPHQIRTLQERADIHHEDNETASQSSYETEEDESINVTGLDSPVTRVWDSKNKRNSAVSRIRHPLETSDIHSTKKKANHIRHPRILRTPSGRKKTRSSNHKPPLWLEIERRSFLLGEEKDILNEATKDATVDVPSNAPDVDNDGRIHCGGTASSSMSSVSASESFTSFLKSPKISLLADSFLKLKCEVLGANVVKSGLGTFAVYSIAVTDANKHCWSIKRRFRHFEELHRRLKEFSEYNLSLPPKHFLSSGLDVPVVQERCKLLDRYLKRLLELPTISGSIEVWDFLSVDSQTYMFSDSLSVIQTLSVDLDDKPYEKSGKAPFLAEVANNQLGSQKDHLGTVIGENTSSAYLNDKCGESDALGLMKRKNEEQSIPNAHKDGKSLHLQNGDAGSGLEKMIQKKAPCPSKPENERKGSSSGTVDVLKTPEILEADGGPACLSEWVSPNLSVPILDLVDVIFQLKDGGWIRRQAFWVAKQLLQLGMGDAFDDWLIDKIQLLTEGSVVANIIRRIEQILWPDGIFLTKHPKRKPSGPVSSPRNIESRNSFLTSEQQLDAARRAKFVYELIIDKAPATLVGLVGRKEYEQCAQDVYFFLQSAVCLKQLAVELLELLLLAAFPELEDVIRQCHENKDQFGAFEE